MTIPKIFFEQTRFRKARKREEEIEIEKTIETHILDKRI